MSSSVPSLFLSKYKNKGKVPAPQLRIFSKPTPATAPIIGEAGEYQCDLMFLPDYTRFNAGKGVILNLINVPTRYLYSVLIKTKGMSASELIKLIPTLPLKMTSLRIDNGTEFVNKALKDFAAKHNIELKVINKNQNEVATSLSIVERVNKTVRDLIERYLELNSERTGLNKYRYEHAFDEIIKAYNTSPHSGIASASASVSPQNSLDLFTRTEMKPLNDESKHIANSLLNADAKKIERRAELVAKIKAQLKPGSNVHALATKRQYAKSSEANFSPEVNKVKSVRGLHVTLGDSAGKVRSKLYHEVTPASGLAANEKLPIKTESKPVKSESIAPTKKQIRTTKSIARKEKRENTSAANIIEAPRNRKAPVRINL